jgi:hypothetical protein
MKYKLVKIKSPCWCNITDHALDQYISRWEPNINASDAEKNLIKLLNSSKKNGKTAIGDDIYISGTNPNIRMVVKDYNVCVTVLPHHMGYNYEQDYQYMIREEFYEQREDILCQIDNLTKECEDTDEKINKLKESIDKELKKLINDKGFIKNKIHNLQKKLEKIPDF